MKPPLILAALLALGAFGWSAGMIVAPVTAQSPAETVAATRTATFAIENMTCALCPVTVKKALQGVNGVSAVRVDFNSKTASVVFDPALTTPEAIAAASTAAGYPAALKG
ncbi:MAG: cation transporter [Alphaproteobacteria bacterium]|nr:cation transporter [Alphaproteobacteria bacterium]